MAFFFITCGTHTFRNQVEGADKIAPLQCSRCHNMSGRIQKEWPWFTLCFVPLIPLGKSWKQVYCPICGHADPLDNRPDAQQALDNVNKGGGGGGQQIPLQQGQSEAYNNGQYPQSGQPPTQPQQPYYQQSQPQYK